MAEFGYNPINIGSSSRVFDANRIWYHIGSGTPPNSSSPLEFVAPANQRVTSIRVYSRWDSAIQPGNNGVISVGVITVNGSDEQQTLSQPEYNITVPENAPDQWFDIPVSIDLIAGETYKVGVRYNGARILRDNGFTMRGVVINNNWPADISALNASDDTNSAPYAYAITESTVGITSPDVIQGDGTGIPYTGGDLSTTEPMRFFMTNGSVSKEVALPTNQTDSSSGTFDFIAGADDAVAGNGNQGIGAPYTESGWTFKLIMRDSTNTFDYERDVTHLIKTGANVQEFSASSYNETGNGRLNTLTNFIGDNDQLYQASDQLTNGNPNPLTLDFEAGAHPGPASVGGDAESFTGSNFCAWYNTPTLKWIAIEQQLTPDTPPVSGEFGNEFDIEFAK